MDSLGLQYRLLATLIVVFTVCSLGSGALKETCSPVTCPPGFQITNCDKDGEPYRCEPCEKYKVQPYNVSSKDEKIFHTCFGAPFPDDPCKVEGAINSRWKDDTSCGKSCECDVANCYVGETACVCQKYEPCGVNEQMNNKTGACEPCPPHKEKKEPGCYPCQYVYTSGQDTPGSPAPPERTKPSTSGILTTRDSTPNQTTNLETPLGTESQISDEAYDAGMTTDPMDVGDTICIDKSIAFTVLGVLLFLMICVEPLVLFAICTYWRRSKTSYFNKCTEEKKTNGFTIIQENSLMLNIKDNNTNAVRELEVTSNNQVNNVNQRNSPGDQPEKTVNKRTTSEEPQESGYGSQFTCSDPDVPSSKSRLISQTSSCSSPSSKNNTSYLATMTLLPTEHDEESTHVKYISD